MGMCDECDEAGGQPPGRDLQTGGCFDRPLRPAPLKKITDSGSDTPVAVAKVLPLLDLCVCVPCPWLRVLCRAVIRKIHL